MSYRNIDSILKDQTNTGIIGSGTTMSSMSTVPESGEEVVVETLYEDFIGVEVHTSLGDGNTYRGVAKQESWEGEIGEMVQHVEIGDLLEFSQLKICSIHRS